MVKQLFLSLVVLAVTSVNAQSIKNVEKGLFKLNALLPGASYELGVGNNNTFNFDAFLIPSYEDSFFNESIFTILPGLQAEFRHFTSFKRRRAKGKNIADNSSDYVAIVNQYYSGNSIINDERLISSFHNNIAIVYGFQRTAPKGFYWNLSFGPAVLIDEFDVDGGILIDAKLGWVIRKRK